MRRVRWQDNDGAVAIALVGVLLIAAALSLYGTGGTPDDMTYCRPLVLSDTTPAGFETCNPWRDGRAHAFRGLGTAGLVALVLALVLATTRRRWVHQNEDLAPSLAALAWSVLPPLVIVVLWSFTLPAGQADDGVTTALGQVFVAIGVFLAWWGASLLRDTPTRAHLLTAAAAAVPLACAGVAAWEAHDSPFPEATFPFPDPWSPVLFSAVATAVFFGVAVLLAKTGRRAPNLWVGAALFAVSTAVTVAVFVPDLVPSWRTPPDTSAGRPGHTTWLPVLLAPAALTALVWAGHAMSRRRPAEPRVQLNAP